ncbi:MAG: PDZ domain-containing protein [Corynebacteriales bacterium]|nr:PDZ domain-containing protein [Mycobacteriales bacterium]
MSRRGWSVVAGALVVFLLALGLSQMTVPYVALAPGRAVDTLGAIKGKPVIEVKGAQATDSQGQLSLTTVSVYDGIDFFTALRMWFDDDIALVPRESVYPPGESEQESEKKAAADWQQSQDSAEVVALRELGYPTQVAVKSVTQGAPADGKLAPGDVVTAVNGTAVDSGSAFIEALSNKKPGEQVALTYQRGDTQGTVDVVLEADEKDSKQGRLGIEISQEQPHPFELSFDLKGIGGPSAGLMFALGIIDKIDDEDLTGGKKIAGTGTIADTGKVGAIGGIPQKMIGALDEGSTVFLTPAANCAEAKRAKPDGLTLVKVSKLDDALTALEMIRNNTGTPAGC